MNKKFTALAMAALLIQMDTSAFIQAMEISAETYASANESHQWKGKKVAFLGDSSQTGNESVHKSAIGST